MALYGWLVQQVSAVLVYKANGS